MSDISEKISMIIENQAKNVLASTASERFGELHPVNHRIFHEVLINKKMLNDIGALEDYAKYYGNENDTTTQHLVSMAVRIGVRLGVLYTIKEFVNDVENIKKEGHNE